MYMVKVDMADILNDQVISLYVERFANMLDAQMAYVSKVNKYCTNKDYTIEYDICLSEIDNNGNNEVIYRTICK